MQLDRDKLMWLALGALDELVQQAHEAPIEPSLSVRALLAAAFACSDGNREPYDGFWREMQKTHPHASTEHAGYIRCSMMRTQMHCIVRSLGLPDTVATQMKMAHMWRKTPGD
ncbi:MAG TPA: hypothetical protein VNR60_02570 [Croceibacterium sp.]|nr:hypothetical protein [Croceibacterium sp.]